MLQNPDTVTWEVATERSSSNDLCVQFAANAANEKLFPLIFEEFFCDPLKMPGLFAATYGKLQEMCGRVLLAIDAD